MSTMPAQQNSVEFQAGLHLDANAVLLLGSLSSRIEQAISALAQTSANAEDDVKVLAGAINYLADQACEQCLGNLTGSAYEESAKLAEMYSSEKALNKELSERIFQLGQENAKLKEKGITLTRYYGSLVENLQALEFRYFTSGKEPGYEFSPSEQEEMDEETKRWMSDEVRDVFFFDIDGKDDQEPPAKKEKKKGKKKATGTKDNESDKEEETDSKKTGATDGAGDKETEGRKRHQTKETSQEPKLEFDPKDKKTFEKNWVSRHQGDQTITIGQIQEHQYKYAEEAIPLGRDGKPLRLVKYEEAGFEVKIIEKAVVVHIIQGTYVDDAADQERRAQKQEPADEASEKEDNFDEGENVDALDGLADDHGMRRPAVKSDEETEVDDCDAFADGSKDLGETGKEKGEDKVHEPVPEEETDTPQEEGDEKGTDAPQEEEEEDEKGTAPKIFYTVTGAIKLFPHSLLSPSLLSSVLYYLYVLAMSAFRVWEWLQGLGMIPCYGTVDNWKKLAARKLKPLADLLHKDLLTHPVVQGDESPGQTHKEEGRTDKQKSYFFFYNSIKEASHQICIVKYHPGRSGQFAKEDMEGFHGKFESDAYDGYNILGVLRSLCNNHARRKFFYAAMFSWTKYQRNLGKKIMDLFDKAQKEEDQINQEIIESHANDAGWTWDDQAFKERQVQRVLRIKKTMDDIRKCCLEIKADPLVFENCLLMRAVNYFLNNEPGLRMFLEDGRLPFHNMRTEQLIKKYATRRRNTLFNGSPVGAESDAINMTVIYSLELNNLDVRRYLEDYFEAVRGKDAEKNIDLVSSFLPWQPEIQEKYRLPDNPRNRDNDCVSVKL